MREKVKGRYDGLDCTVFEEPTLRSRESPDETVSDFPPHHRVRFSDAENQPLLNTDIQKNDSMKKEEKYSISVSEQAKRAKAIIRGVA